MLTCAHPEKERVVKVDSQLPRCSLQQAYATTFNMCSDRAASGGDYASPAWAIAS